jgi:murein L,D-transpeptidase YafK
MCALKSRRGLRYAGLIALGSLAAQSASGAQGKGGEHARQTRRHVAAHAALQLLPFDIRAPAYATGQDRGLRLAEKGLTQGSRVMLRIFKAESELELWLESGDRFELFASYPICFWSGTLGPKLREGDRQAPEGVYSIAQGQLHPTGKRPHSLDIGFPNALDAAAGRTGSNIWIHGGCGSIGCYAMTDAVMEDIYALAEQALAQGQDRFQVQVFPFRMTAENMTMHRDSPWLAFWANLKEVYDAFEDTRMPPIVAMCGERYVVRRGVVSAREPDAAEAPAPGCAQAIDAGARSAGRALGLPVHTPRAHKARHAGRRLAGRSHAWAHARAGEGRTPRAPSGRRFDAYRFL